MKVKIRVHGKSQSRTALGIINAYLRLHPGATPDEVQQAFPKSLNHRCPADNLIIPVYETLGYEKLFFEHEDEQIVFSNGEKYALVEVWSKEDFDSICEHAKKYGIEVAKENSRPFEKGSFKLEFINIFHKFKWMLLFLLILMLLIILLYAIYWHKYNNTISETFTSKVENVQTKLTSFSDNGKWVSVKFQNGKVLEMTKDDSEYKLFTFLNCPDSKVSDDKSKGWIPLDDTHFETGKAILLVDSENQLKNIAMIMQFFPNSRIKIGGYTDDTGNAIVNKKLSHERARIACEKLVSLGIDSYRLEYEGYGSNYPVLPNDNDNARAANRRVDIRVTKK